MPRRTRSPKWLQAAKARQGAPSKDWLTRALARAGVLPLLQAEEALRDGRIKVDGRVTREPFTPILKDTRVQLDGRDVDLNPRTLVLAFHKPAGIVTDATDAENIGTVFEALHRVLPSELQAYNWHAVGRLDRDTTGLLLFTNDEQFVSFATRPESHVPKTYVARVSGKITEAKLAQLSQGIDLDDGYTRPAKATQPGPDTVQLVLIEGRNHQVKRMLNAVGLPTLQLHRELVGEVRAEVPEGEIRLLTDSEVQEKLKYVPRHLIAES